MLQPMGLQRVGRDLATEQQCIFIKGDWEFFPLRVSHWWGTTHIQTHFIYHTVVQSPSHVRLYTTPWTAALQASLSITDPQGLFKFMSVELVVLSNHLILCRPFSFCLQSFPASGSFLMSQLFASGGQRVGASASALMNMCMVGSIKWELSELWKVNYLDCPEDWGQIIIE